MPHTTAPLRLGVVGAGRVGTVLGAGLRAAGHHVVGVTARSPGSRERAAALLPGVPVLEAAALAPECDLLLLTVPDDALAATAAGLATAGALRPGLALAHASGRYGTGLLADVVPDGVLLLAVHPAMTFTGTARDLPRLAGCPFAVTSTGPAAALAERLVADLGGRTVPVAEQRRVLYHAGLCHGANHLVPLVTQAADLLRAAGLADPAATLRPLLSAALDNALTLGEAALTGPVVRGDLDTVRGHLDAVAEARPEVVETYRAMARACVGTAVHDGRLGPDGAAALEALLESGAR